MGNALKWQVIARIRYADEEGERESRSNSGGGVEVFMGRLGGAMRVWWGR